MWFGEPHPFSRKRITYQTEHVGATKLKWVIMQNVNYPLFMSDFNETWIFSIDFQEVLEYKILWKSVQ
jgi:hypothetical protein